MKTEYLYILSNGSTEIYDNTLTNFKNDVILRKKRKVEEIAVSEIYIEDRFTSPYVPKNDLCPTIICSKVEPEKLSESTLQDLHPSEKVFLFQTAYNFNQLLECITRCTGSDGRNNNNTDQTHLWWQNVKEQKTYIGCFKSSKTGASYHQAQKYFLYMYKPLAKALRNKYVEGTEPIQNFTLYEHEFEVFKLNSKSFYFCV